MYPPSSFPSSSPDISCLFQPNALLAPPPPPPLPRRWRKPKTASTLLPPTRLAFPWRRRMKILLPPPPISPARKLLSPSLPKSSSSSSTKVFLTRFRILIYVSFFLISISFRILLGLVCKLITIGNDSYVQLAV